VQVLRVILGLLAVTILQVSLFVLVAWIERDWDRKPLTLVMLAAIVVAGVACFRVAGQVSADRAVKVAVSVGGVLFSTYWSIFAVLNTFGS
jgi:hypothetical protein